MGQSEILELLKKYKDGLTIKLMAMKLNTGKPSISMSCRKLEKSNFIYSIININDINNKEKIYFYNL